MLIVLSSGALGVPVVRFNLGALGAAIIGVDWSRFAIGGS